MIKNSEHAYIEWKSKLELVMKEQYNITKQCDYAFGWCLSFVSGRNNIMKKCDFAFGWFA